MKYELYSFGSIDYYLSARPALVATNSYHLVTDETDTYFVLNDPEGLLKDHKIYKIPKIVLDLEFKPAVITGNNLAYPSVEAMVEDFVNRYPEHFDIRSSNYSGLKIPAKVLSKKLVSSELNPNFNLYRQSLVAKIDLEIEIAGKVHETTVSDYLDFRNIYG